MPWGFTGLVVVVPAVGRFFEREESEEGIGIVGILIRGVLRRTGTAMIFSYKGGWGLCTRMQLDNVCVWNATCGIFSKKSFHLCST